MVEGTIKGPLSHDPTTGQRLVTRKEASPFTLNYPVRSVTYSFTLRCSLKTAITLN